VTDLFPAYSDFAAAFDAGRNQVVWTRLVADLDTPVSLMLKLTEARKDSFMLESVTGGEIRGRYSIMGMKPDLIWDCRGGQARINRSARFDAAAWTAEAEAPLASLRALIAESRIDLPAGLPPMAAGLFGYLGYDMVRLVERLPDQNPDTLGLPDAVFLRPSVVLVVDGVKGEVTVVSPAWAGSGLSAKAAYAQAAERVMDAVRDLDRTPVMSGGDRDGTVGEPVSNTTPEEYAAIVERAKHYSRASAGRRPSGCRPSRSTGRCDGPIPAPTCSISTSAASSSWARAPRSWCGSRRAGSRSDPLRAPGRGARRRRRTWRWRSTCWPIPRSGRST
jgi:anthranilate synthase component 1